MTLQEIIRQVCTEFGLSQPYASVDGQGRETFRVGKPREFKSKEVPDYNEGPPGGEPAGVYFRKGSSYFRKDGRLYLQTPEEIPDDNPQFVPLVDRVIELCQDHGVPEPTWEQVSFGKKDQWKQKVYHWQIRIIGQPYQPTSWAPPELMSKMQEALADGSWKAGYATSHKSESKLYQFGEEVTTLKHSGKFRYYFMTSCRGYCGAFCLMRSDGQICRTAYKLIRVPKKEQNNAN